MDTLKFQNKLDEIFLVEPNDLKFAILTSSYKRITGRLKTVPFIILVPLSFLLAFGLYILVGLPIVRAVSLLQNGF